MHEDQLISSLLYEKLYPPVAIEAGFENLLYVYSIHLNDTGIFDVQIHRIHNGQDIDYNPQKMFLSNFEKIVSKWRQWLYLVLYVEEEEYSVYYLPFKFDLTLPENFVNQDGSIRVEEPINLIPNFNCE